MIKNLLFDLGGVIMEIRRENCIEAFRGLGMAHPEDFLGEYVQSGPFEGIESGAVAPEEFREHIRTVIGNKALTDKEIDDAFQKFLIGIPLHRLRELEALRKNFRVYMLSNTNPIMWNDLISSEFRKDGHDVDYYFDGIVKSFEAKSMKPSEKIFRYVIDHFGLSTVDTLFLDDSQKNLDTSAELGFHTLLVPPGSEFYELLKTYPGLKF